MLSFCFMHNDAFLWQKVNWGGQSSDSSVRLAWEPCNT
uniref:Uncharacterized protein n=1 Tax=Arundo donax TaxID=35708 RepID=A0A0A9AXR7_ARUDO